MTCGSILFDSYSDKSKIYPTVLRPFSYSVSYEYKKDETNYTLREKTYISSLVKDVRKNKVLAMQTLYEMYVKQMWAASYRITNNIADTEDVIQDAFLKSFSQIHQLRDDKKYGGWLKQIVINLSISRVKNRVHFVEVQGLESFDTDEKESRWYESIPFEDIRAAIQQLPDGSRQVFSLYLMEGYKHKDIASMLNISVLKSLQHK